MHLKKIIKEYLCRQFGLYCSEYVNFISDPKLLFIGSSEEGKNNSAVVDLANLLHRSREGATRLPSGYVYLGQFLAHDITLLPRGRELSRFKQLSLEKLKQKANPALDLDSVYGGRKGSQMPSISGGEMDLGPKPAAAVQGSTNYDLPRDSDAAARIGDDRNDTNLLVAQLHVQFLKLHNYFFRELKKRKFQDVVELNDSQINDLFDQARVHLQFYYQEVIIYDLLFKVLDEQVWKHYFVHRDSASILDPFNNESTRIPIEFSGAALRIGHSMVRNKYAINESDEKVLTTDEIFKLIGRNKFNLGNGDSVFLPEDSVIDWRLFFDFGHDTDVKAPEYPLNYAERIDTVVDMRPGGRPEPERSIARRNLFRSNELPLPSGQTMAMALLDPRQYGDLSADMGLDRAYVDETHQYISEFIPDDFIDLNIRNHSPLWFYCLVEAESHSQGQRLGKIGSLIIADTLRYLIHRSPISFFRDRSQIQVNVVPAKQIEIAGEYQKHVRMTDLLKLVMDEKFRSNG